MILLLLLLLRLTGRALILVLAVEEPAGRLAERASGVFICTISTPTYTWRSPATTLATAVAQLSVAVSPLRAEQQLLVHLQVGLIRITMIAPRVRQAAVPLVREDSPPIQQLRLGVDAFFFVVGGAPSLPLAHVRAQVAHAQPVSPVACSPFR